MAASKFNSSFRIGLVIVSLVFLLFSFRVLIAFALGGEWAVLEGRDSFVDYLGDVTATIGLVFRAGVSVLAFGLSLSLFAKKGHFGLIEMKISQVAIFFEAVYWASFLVSGVKETLTLVVGFYGTFAVASLIATGIPCLLEAILMPFALFKLALELRSGRPTSGAIKWGLLAGTFYIFVLWVNNLGMWILTILKPEMGLVYVFSNLGNFLSFWSYDGGFVLAVCVHSCLCKEDYWGGDSGKA